MKNHLKIYSLAALLALVVGVTGCAHQPVKRVGMVVGIREDRLAEYKQLHADSNPGVRDLLAKYHMHNFSIYLQQIDGKWYEFGYDDTPAKISRRYGPSGQRASQHRMAQSVRSDADTTSGRQRVDSMMERAYCNP